MRFLSIVFSALVASGAVAQEVIPFPFEQLPVGSRLTYQTNDDQIYVRQLAFNEGGTAKLAVLDVGRRDAVARTLVMNEQGLITHIEYPNGRREHYDPHTCFRVIGDCSFTYTNANGGTYARDYFSEMIDGVLHVELRNAANGVLLNSYRITYSPDGMLQELIDTREYGGSGKVFEMRLWEIELPDEAPLE